MIEGGRIADVEMRRVETKIEKKYIKLIKPGDMATLHSLVKRNFQKLLRSGNGCIKFDFTFDEHMKMFTLIKHLINSELN